MAGIVVPDKYISLVPGTISAEQACKLDKVEKKWGLNFRHLGLSENQQVELFRDAINNATAHVYKEGGGITITNGKRALDIGIEDNDHSTLMIPDANRGEIFSQILNGKPTPQTLPPTEEHRAIHNETLDCFGQPEAKAPASFKPA